MQENSSRKNVTHLLNQLVWFFLLNCIDILTFFNASKRTKLTFFLQEYDWVYRQNSIMSAIKRLRVL